MSEPPKDRETPFAAFADALRAEGASLPSGVIAYNSNEPRARFSVYRNNVMSGLIGALEARFPATRKIVGEEFFNAAAGVFAGAQPPRSPLMAFYGEEFPQFLSGFEPAKEIPYLADVARLEAARTCAYHAGDAEPLALSALRDLRPKALALSRFSFHPSFEIVASSYPIVTIWAMNSGELDLAPIEDWRGEDALVSRPAMNVEVRRLSPGESVFLQRLAKGELLGASVASAAACDEKFDLAASLAMLFSGLAIGITSSPVEA